MPKIYDNIHDQLSNGLAETLKLSKRADFCVGYFNLRGWHEIADAIDELDGMTILENNDHLHRYCRLLIGMQRLPVDILKDYFLHNEKAGIFDEDDMPIRFEKMRLITTQQLLK
jgi:hypothetical protein